MRITPVRVMVVLCMLILFGAIVGPATIQLHGYRNELATLQVLKKLTGAIKSFKRKQHDYPTSSNWKEEVCHEAESELVDVFCEPMRRQGFVHGYRYFYDKIEGGSYRIALDPRRPRRTGNRSMYVDGTDIIRHCWCRVAGACGMATVASKPTDRAPDWCER